MHLAIDLWDKRVWIAIELNNIVFPKEIVNRVKIINRLKYYINEYDIKVIIVWLPYDLYWKYLKQLNKTERFIEKLKIIFPEKEIIWIDERYTTFEAKNISKWDSKGNIDDISAALILETYLRKYN